MVVREWAKRFLRSAVIFVMLAVVWVVFHDRLWPSKAQVTDIVDATNRNQEVLKAQDAAARYRADRMARERAVEEERATALSAVRALVNLSALGGGRDVPIAVAPASQDDGDVDAARLIPSLLQTAVPRAGLAPGYFAAGFERSPYFQRAFQGDLRPFAEAEVLKGVRAVVLGMARTRCGPASAPSGWVSCSIELDYRVIDGTGSMSDTRTVAKTRTSTEKAAAIRDGAQLLIDEHGSTILQHLTRGEGK